MSDMMPMDGSPSPPHLSPSPVRSHVLHASLDRLDEVLFASRRWVKRPGHRRRFQDLLDRPIALTSIRVLRVVESHQDDPTIGDVATTLGVDPSSASRFVEAVVARGDVERRSCSSDGRLTRLRLTGAGRESLFAVTLARRAVLSEVTAGWDDEEIGRLTDLLERLGSGFDALEDRA